MEKVDAFFHNMEEEGYRLAFNPPTPPGMENWEEYEMADSYDGYVSSDDDRSLGTCSVHSSEIEFISATSGMEYHLDHSAYQRRVYQVSRLKEPWGESHGPQQFEKGETYFRLAHAEASIRGIEFHLDGDTFTVKVGSEKVNFGQLMRYCYSYLIHGQIYLLAREGCKGDIFFFQRAC